MGSPYRTAAESEPTCALEPPRPYIVEREGTFVNYEHLKELQTKYEALLVDRDEWKARAEKSDAEHEAAIEENTRLRSKLDALGVPWLARD